MSVENDNELEHEEPAPEEVTPVSSSLSSSQKAFGAVAAAVVFVIMLIVWSTYLVNDNWGLALVVVGVPIVAGFAFHRRHDSTKLLMGIFAICTLNVWLAYFRSPRLLLLALAIIIMIGGIRSILLYVRGTEREAILESFRDTKRPKKVNDRLMMELHDDERYVIVTRTHPIDSFKWFAAMFVWTAIWLYLVAMTSISFLTLLVVYLVGLALPATKALLWEHERICLTNHFRLFVMKGIIKRSTPGTDARKLTDTTPETPRLSATLSWMRIIKVPYGSYRLENAGQDQALTNVGPIPAIDAFKRAISQMIASDPDDKDD
jgi:hypothetical protein